MILSYQYSGKSFRFVSKDKKSDNDNIYTIIVGKNGSGKSRLLSSVVSKLLNRAQAEELHNESDLGFKPTTHSGKLETAYHPSKIITASTSPFDRFPLARRSELIDGYSYLGLRDLPSTNFGLSYLSKVISSLIDTISDTPQQMDGLKEVLTYLGYHDSIRIKLEYRLTSTATSELISTTDPIDAFYDFLNNQRGPTVLNRRFFYEQDNTPNEDRIYRLFYILGHISLPTRRSFTSIEISSGGIIQQATLFENSSKDISFLLQCGVLRVKDVELRNIEQRTAYSISSASSGEQSVVISILGIASQICDNALICIDEPEICLHPEWQEKYIQLLISTFRHYKGCHFLIATHSPQIISKLEEINCYVLSMDNGKAISSKSLINHSADFQLANVFNSPGFKNEYLSRIGLNTLTKVTTNKIFDKDDIFNLNILKTQAKFLEENDPVLMLLTVLQEMKQQYA